MLLTLMGRRTRREGSTRRLHQQSARLEGRCDTRPGWFVPCNRHAGLLTVVGGGELESIDVMLIGRGIRQATTVTAQTINAKRDNVLVMPNRHQAKPLVMAAAA